MNISLTPRLEALVKEKVESGLYNSSSEVIREALRLLEEKDKTRDTKREALIQEIRDAIQAGRDSGDAGPFNVEDIIALGCAKLEAKQNEL